MASPAKVATDRNPSIPLVPGGAELMVLVYGTRGIVVSEHLINEAPVFSHTYVFAGGGDLTLVLDRLGFPEHALIVRTVESDGRYDRIRGLLHNI